MCLSGNGENELSELEGCAVRRQLGGEMALCSGIGGQTGLRDLPCRGNECQHEVNV